MNKNKGIWIVIASILVIGVVVTLATSSFIKRNGGSLSTTASPALSSPQAGGAPVQSYSEAVSGEETGVARRGGNEAADDKSAEQFAGDTEAAGSVQKRDVAEAPMKADMNEAAAVPQMAPVPQAAADGQASEEQAFTGIAEDASPEVLAKAPSISPLGPAGSSMTAAGTEEMKAYYEKRLADLDAQIQKMRSESTDSTTYSMKTLAEKELRLWNNEMGTVYGVILEVLDEEGEKKLETSQQEWLKTRDAKAEETARKYSGGSLEGVEYTASLAESTRQRTYDLIEEYIYELSVEIKQ